MTDEVPKEATNQEGPKAQSSRSETPASPPEDAWSGRIAVATIGFSLVAFMVGAALIAADGKPVPTQYWSTGSALSGALLGVLAPTPTRFPNSRQPKEITPNDKVQKRVGDHIANAFSEFVGLASDVWKNRQLLVLLLVFVVSATLAAASNSAPLETVAAAAGGALIGLIAPSPGSPKKPASDEQESVDEP